MLKISLFSRSGKLVSNKIFDFVKLRQYNELFGFHSFYNKFKLSIGRLLGINVYTIADN